MPALPECIEGQAVHANISLTHKFFFFLRGMSNSQILI